MGLLLPQVQQRHQTDGHQDCKARCPENPLRGAGTRWTRRDYTNTSPRATSWELFQHVTRVMNDLSSMKLLEGSSCSHCTDEETEAQRGLISGQKLPSWWD